MKILIALMGLIAATGAFAEDVPSVTERVSCADVQAMISELAAIEEPTDDEIAELENLKIDYRSKCARSAAKRKSSALKNTVVAAMVVVPEEVAEETVAEVEADATETAAVKDEEFVAEETVEIDEESLLAQELANLDAGLCIDGTKPNKFGCCADEVFKDLGNSVFACCPKTGDGECFPPIE